MGGENSSVYREKKRQDEPERRRGGGSGLLLSDLASVSFTESQSGCFFSSLLAASSLVLLALSRPLEIPGVS